MGVGIGDGGICESRNAISNIGVGIWDPAIRAQRSTELPAVFSLVPAAVISLPLGHVPVCFDAVKGDPLLFFSN